MEVDAPTGGPLSGYPKKVTLYEPWREHSANAEAEKPIIVAMVKDFILNE